MGVCVACFDEKLVDVYCQSANIFGTGENGFLYRFCINGTFYVSKAVAYFSWLQMLLACPSATSAGSCGRGRLVVSMPSKRNVGICLLDRNGATMNPEASSGISFREVYKRVSLLLMPKMICLFGILQRALYVSQLKTRGICSNFRKISHKKRPCRFFSLVFKLWLVEYIFLCFPFLFANMV